MNAHNFSKYVFKECKGITRIITNLVYFLALYFSNYPVDYLYLFKNSIFTFIFYPILWGVFSIIFNLTKL